MQNLQEVNWWLEIIKIAVPSLIALAVPLLTYLWLSKKIENFKNQLQLETCKFQTKFSLFHQRQTSAIEELYSLLARAENSLANTRVYLENLTIEEKVLNLEKGNTIERDFIAVCQNLAVYFDEKRIFFDSDVEQLVSSIIKSIENSYKYSSFSKYVKHGIVKSDKTSDEFWKLATELIEIKIPEVKEKLRQEFRQRLSAETPNYQIEK